MERSLGSGGMGFGANLLSSFAMGFLGSMVAQSFFSALGGFGDEASAEDADPSAAGDGQLAENASDDDEGADFGGDFDV